MRAHTCYTMYYSMITWALLARKCCFVRHKDLHTHSTVPEPELEQHLSMFVAYREHNTSHTMLTMVWVEVFRIMKDTPRIYS